MGSELSRAWFALQSIGACHITLICSQYVLRDYKILCCVYTVYPFFFCLEELNFLFRFSVVVIRNFVTRVLDTSG
jgi:hypothetical protein